jgi:hypothetical protein
LNSVYSGGVLTVRGICCSRSLPSLQFIMLHRIRNALESDNTSPLVTGKFVGSL